MPEVIPGMTTEQKTLTVTANDESMNDAITGQAADGWLVSLLVLSGSDIIILFTRTIPTPVV